MGFLPICLNDLVERGWSEVDFVFVNGDAYVDHPSFGVAIISRLLENAGFRVGIISQPDVKNPSSVRVFGQPKLGFLVSAGNMDSMVNHYTVSKNRRERDSYSPNGQMGLRPDRAATVYSRLIKKAYKNSPIILGGIEASLRRLAHYDYWSNSFMRSILIDSKADILVYGMGEKAILEIAYALKNNIKINDLTFIKGTVFKTQDISEIYNPTILPYYSAVKNDKSLYAKSFMLELKNNDYFRGNILIEKYDEGYVVQNPPSAPLSTQEMDEIYALKYMRDYHPIYKAQGGVPAIEEVKFSITSSRGCFGSCNFCALSFHQGRIIQSRSHESIIAEAELLTTLPDFKGYINDVGGPTANFRRPACKNQQKNGACADKMCLFPTPCKNLDTDHTDYVELLTKLRAIKRVKKVFVRSGVRFDFCMLDKSRSFLKALCAHHVSGQLKVAPEHVSDEVLYYMGKPKNQVFNEFKKAYERANQALDKKQYLVPYFMSSHPGSQIKNAIELAQFIKRTNIYPEQVQDFYPTPSTISTCMFFTEIDPRTLKPVYVAKNPHEKAMQRALIQFNNPKNYALVNQALIKANRQDLIGFNPSCLIKPRSFSSKRSPKLSKR